MSSPQPNILQLAHQMADEMTKDDSVDLQNMDMESMISHVTKNVMEGMMQNENFMKSMEATTKELQKQQQQVQEQPVVEVEEDEELAEEEDGMTPTKRQRYKF